jgi:hypothetical protein
MEQEILTRLQAQEVLLQNVFKSVEKTRKYFLYTMIGSILLIVLPLLALVFVLPNFISTLTAGYGI